MEFLSEIDFSVLKKLKVLSILEAKGEQEALRLYPELSEFIYFCRDRSIVEVREDLVKPRNGAQAH